MAAFRDRPPPPGSDGPDGGSPLDHVALAERLSEARASTVEQIARLTDDLAGIVDSSMSVATDDEHDPEGATIAFERAQVSALLDQARGRLADLDNAAAHLADGTYGRCERCGRPIDPERLMARPAARTCITCAARR